MHCEKAEMLLPLLVFDEIEDGEKAELLAHLSQCGSCSEKLGDLRVTLNLLRDGVAAMPVPVLSPKRRTKLMKKLAKEPRGSKRRQPTARPARRSWLHEPLKIFTGGSVARRVLGIAASLTLVTALVGIMLPSLGTARRTARQMQNNTQGRGIHSGLVLQSQETGRYPDSLGDLVDGHYVSPEYLISPNDTRGIRVPDNFQSLSKSERAAWANENSSYAFVRPGDQATNDSRRIVLFEKPSPGQKSIAVVYDDNHSVTVPVEEAAREIQASTGKSLEEWNESFAFREKLRTAEVTNSSAPLPAIVNQARSESGTLAWGGRGDRDDNFELASARAGTGSGGSTIAPGRSVIGNGGEEEETALHPGLHRQGITRGVDGTDATRFGSNRFTEPGSDVVDRLAGLAGGNAMAGEPGARSNVGAQVANGESATAAPSGSFSSYNAPLAPPILTGSADGLGGLAAKQSTAKDADSDDFGVRSATKEGRGDHDAPGERSVELGAREGLLPWSRSKQTNAYMQDALKHRKDGNNDQGLLANRVKSDPGAPPAVDSAPIASRPTGGPDRTPDLPRGVGLVGVPRTSGVDQPGRLNVEDTVKEDRRSVDMTPRPELGLPDIASGPELDRVQDYQKEIRESAESLLKKEGKALAPTGESWYLDGKPGSRDQSGLARGGDTVVVGGTPTNDAESTKAKRDQTWLEESLTGKDGDKKNEHWEHLSQLNGVFLKLPSVDDATVDPAKPGESSQGEQAERRRMLGVERFDVPSRERSEPENLLSELERKVAQNGPNARPTADMIELEAKINDEASANATLRRQLRLAQEKLVMAEEKLREGGDGNQPSAAAAPIRSKTSGGVVVIDAEPGTHNLRIQVDRQQQGQIADLLTRLDGETPGQQRGGQAPTQAATTGKPSTEADLYFDLKENMWSFHRAIPEDRSLTSPQQGEQDIKKWAAYGEAPQSERREQSQQLLEKAAELRKSQEYDRALQLINQAQFIDPENPSAQAMKDMVEDTQLALKARDHLRLRDLRTATGPEMIESTIPYSELITYPSDWPKLTAERVVSRYSGLTAASDVNDRVAEKLQEPIAVNFEGQNLVHVIDHLRNTTGVNFFVNWAALENAGIEQDMPVTLKLGRVPADQALRLVLQQSGAGQNLEPVSSSIIDGIVTISTLRDLSPPPNVQVYDLRSFAESASAEDESTALDRINREATLRDLVATLETRIQNINEKDKEQRASVRELNGMYIVRASPDEHREFRRLIDEAVGGGDARAKSQVRGLDAGDDRSELQPAASFRVVPVNPWTMAAEDAQSTFALDVDTASYTLGRRYIQRGFLPPAGSVRMEEYINAFDYNYANTSDQVFRISAAAAPAPFADPGQVNTKLIKIGIKGKVIGRDGRKPANLVLVVDTSGSMARPDRLPLIQHSLELLAGELSPHDKVSLVTFGAQVVTLLDQTPASNKQAIIQAIRSLQASGPTNLLKGVEAGYAQAAQAHRSGAINRIILCSDGIATLGETEADTILGYVEHYRKQGISCTTVGYGIGAYDDDLMEKLANKGDGTHHFVDSRTQARKVFVDELTAMLATIAKDAKIQVEFNPQRVRRYRLIGYENRAIADKDFRNDTIDAGEVGSGQSSTALYEVELIGHDHGAQAAQVGAEQADLGTVYVRYRNAETDKIEEISQRLSADIMQDCTPAITPRFFLAASAAEFAEILRGSEHARGGSLPRVQDLLEKTLPHLPLDEKARELLDLVRKAQGLPKAP